MRDDSFESVDYHVMLYASDGSAMLVGYGKDRKGAIDHAAAVPCAVAYESRHGWRALASTSASPGDSGKAER